MFFAAFLPKLFHMSLTASVAIVVVLALRLLLKKAPKAISYALWGVVLFRLLCPVSIQSDFSLFRLFEAPAGAGAVTDRAEVVPPDRVQTEAAASVLVSGAGETSVQTGTARPTEGERMTAAAGLWAAGASAMAVWAGIQSVQLRRKLVTASPLRDNIYLADEIESPFVMGLFRPKIYLPSGLEEQERSYIIAHEQHHIRRLDPVLKMLGFTALCIHWFNPLVWLAFLLAVRDMEMSCDEAVVRKMGQRVVADYAASLLSLSTGRRIIAGAPLAFGEGDTKGRIRNLARWKKPKRVVFVALCLLAAVCAVALLSNPASTPLSKLSVDEVDMQAALAQRESLTLRSDRRETECDDETANRVLNAMDEIKIRENPVSENRSEERERNFTITIDGGLDVHFSDDFSEVWIDNGVKPSFSYRVLNPGRARTLLQDLFSGPFDGAEILKWFDFFSEEETPWDGSQEIRLDAFPDTTFRATQEQVQAVPESGEPCTLYTGTPVWSVYFSDLTGDGMPELCSAVAADNGEEGASVLIYDYANGASYSLQGSSEYSYSLSAQEDRLVVTQSAFADGQIGKLVATDYLTYLDGALMLVPTDSAGAAESGESEHRYQLTLGSGDVAEIRYSVPMFSVQCIPKDGGLFLEGDSISLEIPEEVPDLRGLKITAINAQNEIIWSVSVPDEEQNAGFTRLTVDGWTITDVQQTA